MSKTTTKRYAFTLPTGRELVIRELPRTLLEQIDDQANEQAEGDFIKAARTAQIESLKASIVRLGDRTVSSECSGEVLYYTFNAREHSAALKAFKTIHEHRDEALERMLEGKVLVSRDEGTGCGVYAFTLPPEPLAPANAPARLVHVRELTVRECEIVAEEVLDAGRGKIYSLGLLERRRLAATAFSGLLARDGTPVSTDFAALSPRDAKAVERAYSALNALDSVETEAFTRGMRAA